LCKVGDEKKLETVLYNITTAQFCPHTFWTP
jgi:hypothetical protein